MSVQDEDTEDVATGIYEEDTEEDVKEYQGMDYEKQAVASSSHELAILEFGVGALHAGLVAQCYTRWISSRPDGRDVTHESRLIQHLRWHRRTLMSGCMRRGAVI